MALHDKFAAGFSIGVELVSTRGTMSEKRAIRAKEFARELTLNPEIDWVSITDNAGGNPMLSPEALGTPILFGGRDVLIHLSCKDLNRHGLESRAWALASHGFHNILCISGDYPAVDMGGMPKPSFDLDAVGLLAMLGGMNRGLEVQARDLTRRHLLPTRFCTGAVVNNYKGDEAALAPQYLKLEKKVQYGAQFVINQIGYDARKMHELIAYLQNRNLGHIPLIGNVFVLNPGVARLFYDRVIPGVAISDALFEVCEKQAASPDRGKRFFLELAAKQMAIYQGLGYRGGYLGGVHSAADIAQILNLVRTFSADDWKGFVPDLKFSSPGTFFLYAEDAHTGLSDAGRLTPTPVSRLPVGTRVHHALGRWAHRWAFTRGRGLARIGEWLCRRWGMPGLLRLVERLSKTALFDCKDCGDCSLAEIAFLCPESQCVKNQRNGPCGGSRGLVCEVRDVACIWSRAYERLKSKGREAHLLDHVPVLQDHALQGTSSWANAWLGRDHGGKNKSDEGRRTRDDGKGKGERQNQCGVQSSECGKSITQRRNQRSCPAAHERSE